MNEQRKPEPAAEAHAVRSVGEYVPMIDGPEKVSGRARYTADLLDAVALEAAILAEGGFSGDKSAARQPPQSLLYIRIRGGRSVGEMRELIDADHDGESLMRAAREGIGELIARFDAADQPYLSQPRAQYVNEYGDYDDLARRSEWASQAEGSGE